MTKEDKLMLAKRRLGILQGRGDRNIKCPGVMRKLRREIRNLEK